MDAVSEGRRTFWRYVFQKADGAYTDGKSKSLHYATNWAIPETVDIGNDLSGTDIDIGIAAAPEQQEWIPEITMFQRKVNMGTAPWEWL